MAFPSIDPSAFGQMPSAMSQGFTAPSSQQGGMMGGMFAGMSGGLPPQKFGVAQAISAALNGYLAAMPGPSQQVGLAGIKAQQARQQMSLEEQVYEHRQNLEMQRQMMMMPYQYQLKMLENPAVQTAIAGGMTPGSAAYQQHFATIAGNDENPVVNAGPYGPVLRSQVAGAANARPAPTPAAIAALKANPALASDYDAQFGPGESAKVLGGSSTGGPASQAPGGFLGSGSFSDIGPYHRY